MGWVERRRYWVWATGWYKTFQKGSELLLSTSAEALGSFMLRTRLKTSHLTEGETKAYRTWATVTLQACKWPVILSSGILTLQGTPG